MTIYQTAISGFYYENSKPDSKVILEGWVSEDKRNISLDWTFKDNVNLTLSNDGMDVSL